MSQTEKDLPTLIKTTASRVRRNDFMWAAAITAGIMLAIETTKLVAWWLPIVTWLVFVAALMVRYTMSSGRVWAAPVERVVESEMNAQRAELAALRLAQGVAEALPEPLFILDTEGRIEHANPAAVEFVEARNLEGRHFTTVVRSPTLFEAVSEVMAGEPAHAVDFSTAGAVERHCRAFVAVVREEGDNEANTDQTSRALVYIRDLTSERRVEQMRVDFIASASHELRTPLASLLGFIETLRGHARTDPEAQEKFLGIMQSQAERMQRLVADLMSLSRIELNEHVQPRDEVELGGACDDIVEGLKPLLTANNAIVEQSNQSDGPVTVIGDRDQITQAIQNLLDNASKYGGDDPLIKLKIGVGAAPSLLEDGELAHRGGDTVTQLAARQGLEESDFAYVQVRDFGPGVERADLPRLTERFYRVNIERSRKAGGTGLGLAIVKHILNRHKGGLQVESRLGSGTAFTCYFGRYNVPARGVAENLVSGRGPDRHETVA